MRRVDAEKPGKPAEIEPVLAELLTRLRKRFAEDLLAVALYGSYARDEAAPDSDMDLMVVVRNLPTEWADIFALEGGLASMGPDLGSRLDIRLVEPEAVSYSVSWAAPLMLEVYDAHRIVFDPTGFLASEMMRFTDVMRERGIYKAARGVWKVPAIARQ